MVSKGVFIYVAKYVIGKIHPNGEKRIQQTTKSYSRCWFIRRSTRPCPTNTTSKMNTLQSNCMAFVTATKEESRNVKVCAIQLHNQSMPHCQLVITQVFCTPQSWSIAKHCRHCAKVFPNHRQHNYKRHIGCYIITNKKPLDFMYFNHQVQRFSNKFNLLSK